MGDNGAEVAQAKTPILGDWLTGSSSEARCCGNAEIFNSPRNRTPSQLKLSEEPP